MRNLADITTRRDALLAERREIRKQREAILDQARRVDMELSDCRGTARFFELALEFPEDEADPALTEDRG